MTRNQTRDYNRYLATGLAKKALIFGRRKSTTNECQPTQLVSEEAMKCAKKSPMASRNQLQPLCGSVVFCSAHPILSHCCLLGRRHADLSLAGEAENESASTNMGAASFSSRPHNTPDEMAILRSNGSLIEGKACRNQTSSGFPLKICWWGTCACSLRESPHT